jgi:hypothetical protein
MAFSSRMVTCMLLMTLGMLALLVPPSLQVLPWQLVLLSGIRAYVKINSFLRCYCPLTTHPASMNGGSHGAWPHKDHGAGCAMQYKSASSHSFQMTSRISLHVLILQDFPELGTFPERRLGEVCAPANGDICFDDSRGALGLECRCAAAFVEESCSNYIQY